MFQPDLLRDRVILVTGGGTGLGRSMAMRFAELGARLVITSRKLENLEAAAVEMRERGARVLPVACDVRDPEQVERMVERAEEEFGRIDSLVNNAAGNFLARTENLSANAFQSVIGIVLNGTFHCTQAVGRKMIAGGHGGSILNIVVSYAWTGTAFAVPSACAKAGVLAMTRSLAVEWARFGIRLNAVAPGPFPTEGAWSRLMVGPFEEMAKARVPLRRFGEHVELANLAAFLLSGMSAYITGDCVTIDGGEWLASGGEFNAMTQMPDEALDQLMPRRSRG